MRGFFTALLLLILFLQPALAGAASKESPAEKQAMLAALDFLELADQGKFAECWELTSPVFRDKISKDDWVRDLTHVRPPFGPRQQRTLQFSKPIEPSDETGGRPGLFLIFRTVFTLKTTAELVTMVQDNDQSWRVAGYSIQ